MTKIFLALTLFTSTVVLAETAEISKRLIDVQAKYIAPTRADGSDTRYSSTLFGTMRETIFHHFTFTPIENALIPTRYLESGVAPVQLHLEQELKLDANGYLNWAVKPAPLAVLVNPMFSGANEGQMNRFLDFFAARGYHVVILMNTWSASITDQVPKFMPGDMATEAALNQELLDYVVNQRIGRANITHATMIGLSYGAFMSAVLKSNDAHREPPLIDGPTLVLEAPNNAAQSAINNDRQWDEIQAAPIDCTGANISFFTQMFFQPDFNKTSIDEKCAKQLFLTMGFHDTFIGMLRKLNFSKKLGLTEDQLRTMTYGTYVRDFVKPTGNLDAGDVGYWISDAQKTGYSNFVVLTTEDDNINEGTDLRQNPFVAFNESNLIVLPKGGHTGFRAMLSKDPSCGYDWTDCFLNAVYQ